jgi:Putative phage abortive infection protein
MNRLLLLARRSATWYARRPRRSASVDRHVDAVMSRIEWTFNRLGVTGMEKPDNDPDRRRIVTPNRVFIAACFVVIGSWGIVFYFGSRNWDKENLALRGTFGDSFGVISALFAGLAFIGAAYAAYYQRLQLNAQRDQMRQATASEQASKIEARFFQLLNSLQTAVNETHVDESSGRQAFGLIASGLKAYQDGYCNLPRKGADAPFEDRRTDVDQWFTHFYEGTNRAGNVVSTPYGDILGHIFRLIYHILRFLDESMGVEPCDKKFFARILRAHLSNPELVLLFYNGLSHYGHPKAFELIEKYELLKNINRRALPHTDDALLYSSLSPTAESGRTGDGG